MTESETEDKTAVVVVVVVVVVVSYGSVSRNPGSFQGPGRDQAPQWLSYEITINLSHNT